MKLVEPSVAVKIRQVLLRANAAGLLKLHEVSPNVHVVNLDDICDFLDIGRGLLTSRALKHPKGNVANKLFDAAIRRLSGFRIC